MLIVLYVLCSIPMLLYLKDEILFFFTQKFTEIPKNYCKIYSLQQHYDSRMTFTIILFKFIQLSRRYIKKNQYQK